MKKSRNGAAVHLDEAVGAVFVQPMVPVIAVAAKARGSLARTTS